MRKSFLYIGLIFFIGITLFVFENNSYSVTRPSVRRAGQMGKNTQKQSSSSSNTKAKAARSATTARAAAGTNARAASNARAAVSNARGAKTARVLSRSGSKKPVSNNLAATQNMPAPTGDNCPAMTILRKVTDENGNTVYYSAKNKTCIEPENAHDMSYSAATKSSLPLTMQVKPSWIETNYAYYFECDNGYLLKTVNKVKTCVPFTEICPLNTVVEKINDGFLHPNTQENCYSAEYSTMIDVSIINEIDANQVARYAYDIAKDDMRMFICPANYYAEQISSYTEKNLLVECKPCANGLYSPKGSTGANACKLPCNAGQTSVFDGKGNYECKACNTQCSTYNSQTKSCETKNGWICSANGTGTAIPADSSVCDSNTDLVKDSNGNNMCKCKEGYIGDGIKTSLGGNGCIRECGTNASRRQSDNTCVCNDGYTGDGYTCEEKPKDLSADDCVDNATFENGECKCPDGYMGDGIKDNDTSPLCKLVPNSSFCQHKYDNSTKQGTNPPRGCVPQCESGSYWAPV